MNSQQLLTEKKLSITAGRKLILNILSSSQVALSEKEIRQALDKELDRATIYRTLKLFTEKGIVHAIITERSIHKYVLKKESENHLHFKCTNCDEVICLTGIKISAYELPAGYVEQDTNFLVTGTCKNCNQ